MSRLAGGTAAALLMLLALAAPASADLPYATPTPLATGIGTQSSPSLDDSTGDASVAWEDDASAQWDVLSLFRFLTTPIPAGPSAQRHPTAAGYTVVYEDDRAGNWDIYAYDTFPGDDYTPPPAVRETQLTSDLADQLDPATDGVTVAYEDKSRGNWDIAVWDLFESTGRLITSNAADQVDPAVDRGKVVFADRRNGNWDIYCYDLWKKTLKRLTTNKAAQTMPDVGDGIVVYQDKRNGNWDIYAYYLKSGKERRLTTSTAAQTAPQIGDDRSVVYQDDRAGASDLYLYDLKTRMNRKLTDGPAPETEPSLSGATVAWRDARTDAGDVYLAEILYPDLGLWWATDDESPPPYGSTVRFTGTLTVPYGSVDGLSVLVSGVGKTRKVEVAPIDETNGRFSVALRNVVRKITLRALFRGGANYLPDSDGPVSVKPKALLTRPSLTVRPKKPLAPYGSRDVIVTGYLKPRHPAGSKAVSVECWVYEYSPFEGSQWKLDRTVRATVRDHEGYSAYRLELRFDAYANTPKWKVRAVHADASHAKTVSRFSAVRSVL